MVLIENMDKPKDCESCLLNDADGDCILRKKETHDMETFSEVYRDCPLKEVQI